MKLTSEEVLSWVKDRAPRQRLGVPVLGRTVSDEVLPQDRGLSDLWREAETIGRVMVRCPYGDRSGPYVAEIDFRNGTSKVEAEGTGETPEEALLESIIEAKRINSCSPRIRGESEDRKRP